LQFNRSGVDPANFDLNDCNSQRNLNETGREQAQAWKPLLAEHGVEEARVAPER